MSHNASLGSPPYVTASSPTSITAAGATTITLTGSNLSASCQLDIPAALGTVTGPGVYTAVSGTSGTLAFPVTALAPPGTATARVCTLSNGGTASTGTAVTVWHGWTPALLMIAAEDTWLKAADASAVGDGNLIPAVTAGYGNRGAISQGNTAYQPVYDAVVPQLNNQPGFYLRSHADYHLQGFMPNASWNNLNPSTTAFTFAMLWVPDASAAEHVQYMQFAVDAGGNLHVGNYDIAGYLDKFYHNIGGVQVAAGITTPNTGTTAPRRMIVSGDGTTSANSSYVEPITGFNLTTTPGGVTPGSSYNRSFMGGRDIWVAEVILITGREISAAETVALNTYWVATYG